MPNSTYCRGYEAPLGRRDFLSRFATGLGGIAMSMLLARDARSEPLPVEAADPPPHHPAKVKRVLQIFLQGGLSQVDSFDYKPELQKYHGQPMPGDE